MESYIYDCINSENMDKRDWDLQDMADWLFNRLTVGGNKIEWVIDKQEACGIDLHIYVYDKTTVRAKMLICLEILKWNFF